MPVREVWIAEEKPKEVREVWGEEVAPIEPEPVKPEISPLAQLEYEGLPFDPEARRKEELRRRAMGEVAQAPAVFPLPLPLPGMLAGIGPPAPELSLEAIKKGAVAQVSGATAEQVLEEAVPEFRRAITEGHLPTAVAQTGRALGMGILGFADRVVSQAGEIIQQLASRGEVDLAVVQALGEAKQALWQYDPSDPAAQLATKFVAAVPFGVKTAFHTLADEFKGSPNIEAGLRTVGDMAEIAAFGKVFKTLGVPLKGKEAIRRPGIREVRAADRAIRRDLKRQERLEKAAKAEEAARAKVEEPPPKPKIREAEIGEEVVTVEEALVGRERAITAKTLAKEKETPVVDSSRVIVEWAEVERLGEEARVAREVVKPEVKPVTGPKAETVAAQVNKKAPGNELVYDGEWEVPGRPTVYQFTPHAGKAEGATFVVTKLDAETVRAGLARVKEARKPPVEEAALEVKEVKEPYEMSLNEFIEKVHQKAVDRFNEADKKIKELEERGQWDTEAYRRLREARDEANKDMGYSVYPEFAHEGLVKQAASEGKITSHPDYPELGKKIGVAVEPTITLPQLNEDPGLYKSILDNRRLHTREVVTRAEEIGARVLADIKQEGEIVRRYGKKESTKSIARRYEITEDEVISILDEADAFKKLSRLTPEAVRDRWRREIKKAGDVAKQQNLSLEQTRRMVQATHERLADHYSDRTRYEYSDAEGREIAAFFNEMAEKIEPAKRTAADVDASEAQKGEIARISDEIKGEPDVTLEFGGYEGFGKMYRDFVNSLRSRAVETKKPLSPEATEILDRGEIVKHKMINGRRRPPVFRAELEVLKGLKKLEQVLTHRGFENPIRTFEEAGGKALLDLTVHPYHAREFAIGRMRKAAKKSLKELRGKVGSRSRRRIMIYAVSKQKRGMQLLKFRGIKEIPKLTPEEMNVYNALRERYKSWYVRLNRVRKAIGKEPFPEEKDYFTFIRTLSIMEETGFKPIHVRAATFASQYVKAGATAFRFAKRRVGGKYKLKLDPFEVLEIYEGQAIRHIQLSPLIAKLRELQTVIVDPVTKESFILRNNNPVLAASLHSWTNHIAGLKPAGFELPPFFEKMMLRINSNLTAAILGANLRSAMIQVSALRNTVAEVGFGYTLRGIASLINPRARNMAMRRSKVLSGRRYDVTVEDALRAVRAGRVGELQRVGARAALKPLQILDIETAKACWHGAYKHGLEKLGYKPRRAVTYADDIVTKTQASALPGDIAPVQRAVVGRFLTLFQTFTINDWNFLIRDVLGLRNATVDTPMAFAKALRFVAATTLFNVLFEDVLHIQSPFPTPIRAFRESLERGDDTPSLAWNVGKEFIEPIPIIGAARYGKGPGGPGVELLNETVKYITRKPMAEPGWKLGGEWLGIPGTAQVAKTVRARERGETPYGQIVGTYTPPEERVKPAVRGRGLRTRRKGLRGGL